MVKAALIRFRQVYSATGRRRLQLRLLPVAVMAAPVGVPAIESPTTVEPISTSVIAEGRSNDDPNHRRRDI
jgi:hypothetical protein